MKRFDFTLERVRRWRLEQLDVEDLKLQQVRIERQALSEAKQQVRDEFGIAEKEMLSQSFVQGEELATLESFHRHVRARVRDFENRERQCDARVAEQRARVMEARRQFELLDRLREKALAKWRAAADKEQEMLAGELFLAKSIRNARRS